MYTNNKKEAPFMGASFLAMGDLNDLNATLRWSVARSRLDGNDTIIYSNPSISARIEPISKVYTNNNKNTTLWGGIFIAKMG